MWIVLGSEIVAGARSHDFLNIYTGASLAHEGRFADLHEPSVQLARERRIFPQIPQLVPFVRPSFYAAALVPLSLLPYDTAFAVWIAFQTSLLLGCWIWMWRRFGADALVFAALYLPCALGIATGQDGAMMLALLLISFCLAERGRWFRSGAVLALMLVKFHLILLWPLALLIQKRWRMLAGFCTSAAALVGVSAALGGMRSLRAYLALLQDKGLDRLSPSPEAMISVQGLLSNLGIDQPAAALLFSGVAVAVFFFALRRSEPRSADPGTTTGQIPRLFIVTAAASLWIVPHVYGYDASLLLLPLLLTIYSNAGRASRIAATFLCTPIAFGFAMAGRPWAIVLSLSVAVFFVLVASESSRRFQTPGGAPNPSMV